MNKIISLILLLTATSYLYAQKPPVKFGKISKEELEMTVYEPDTSASAVVLCKYGYFNANELTYTLIRRVKILKKSGTKYSEYTFPGNDKAIIRGKVYNIKNGEVLEERLKKESIFKEKVTDDYYRIRVAMPNIKVGTVYDIETTQSMLPPEFAFQEDIPVKHSEIRLEESQYINYRKRSIGFERFKTLENNRHIAANMPAFKKEPFMNSVENYKTKFEFDILNIAIPGELYRNYTTSWEAVNDRLSRNVYFGGAIFNGAAYLNKYKKEIESTCSSDLEKLEAAYNVIKQVKWNGYETVWSSSVSLITPFKEGKANSAEINMMFLQLLIKLDIRALPVVLSTRENGQLNMFYPSFEKLNYMMVWAKIDDKEYLLDATDELLPLGMLPKRCLNERGRLVTNQSGKWIDLKTDKMDKKVILYNLDLNEQMELNGSLDYCRYDYSAYNLRKRYKEFASSEEYLKSIEYNNPGLLIKDYSFEDIDSLKKPVKDKYGVSIKNKAERVNDMILIDPFLFEKITDNPFKLENRQFPVDFAYKKETYLISKITIPDNYQIEELPKPIKAILPEKTASVLINFQALGNSVTVTYRLQLNKEVYSTEEYEYLRALYAAIINKQAEPIVIKRIPNEASL